jgi:hypothetical protein
LIVGAVFRLAWPGDIEYKGDEAWTFEQTRRIGVTEPLPARGMPTSVGVPNPPLSVTVFWALARMTGAGDPPGLARAVQALNVCALLLFLVFVCRSVRESEREAWLWGLALAALNPMAVLAHRKIWPPSVFLLATLVALAGWRRRDRRAGAFVWGLVSMIAGQIHLSAFFFAAGFALWAVLFDRRRVRWPFWIAGILVGALPMIRWVLEVGHTPALVGATYDVNRIPLLTFYRHWVLGALGLEAKSALGPHFAEFLAGPRIGGHLSYLVGLLHLIALGAGLMLLGPALGRLARQRFRIGEKRAGPTSATAFTVSAVFWGFGLLLTSSALIIHRHYLFVAFPLQWVWLARLALDVGQPSAAAMRRGRRALVVCCLAQLALTASLLTYLHVTGGAPRGDYGVAYRAQVGPSSSR